MKMPQRIKKKLSSLKGLTLSRSTIFNKTKVFSTNATQKYIVILGEQKNKDSKLATLLHISLLISVLGSKLDALASIISSYNSKLSGFYAKLATFQANKLKNLPEVIDLWISRGFSLQTNARWDFLLLIQNKFISFILLKKANQGEGIIIGVIDSDIWHESNSLSDECYGPIPSRWKGSYQADGTIHGRAPRAMLTIYKVIWKPYCEEDAVIDVISDTIDDGVNIVSLSIEASKARMATLVATMWGKCDNCCWELLAYSIYNPKCFSMGDDSGGNNNQLLLCNYHYS